MYLPKHIQKIVFTLIVIHSIRCKALSPKSVEKSNLISKLLNVIDSSEASPKFDLKNVPKKIIIDQKVNLKNLFNNKVLVKRLIPHGYRASNFEYDQKFNTFYKPLVRIHGGKPELIYREKESNNFDRKPSNKQEKKLRDILYKDEELLQPFQMGPRKVTLRSILEDVITYASKLEASERRRLKYAILEILENPKVYLRQQFATGSDERAIANSVIKYEENGNGKPEKKQKKWLPDYSFWNYWTVTKVYF